MQRRPSNGEREVRNVPAEAATAMLPSKFNESTFRLKSNLFADICREAHIEDMERAFLRSFMAMSLQI